MLLAEERGSRMERVFSRPLPGEYAPYTSDYISLVPEDGRLLAHWKPARCASRS
jgi:hypothetical protein